MKKTVLYCCVHHKILDDYYDKKNHRHCVIRYVDVRDLKEEE